VARLAPLAHRVRWGRVGPAAVSLAWAAVEPMDQVADHAASSSKSFLLPRASCVRCWLHGPVPSGRASPSAQRLTCSIP